jgi:hypothetical protein
VCRAIFEKYFCGKQRVYLEDKNHIKYSIPHARNFETPLSLSLFLFVALLEIWDQRFEGENDNALNRPFESLHLEYVLINAVKFLVYLRVKYVRMIHIFADRKLLK